MCLQKQNEGGPCTNDFECHGFCRQTLGDYDNFGTCQSSRRRGRECLRDSECGWRCIQGSCEDIPVSFDQKNTDPMLRQMLQPVDLDHEIDEPVQYRIQGQLPVDFQPLDPIKAADTENAEHEVLRLSGFEPADSDYSYEEDEPSTVQLVAGDNRDLSQEFGGTDCTFEQDCADAGFEAGSFCGLDFYCHPPNSLDFGSACVHVLGECIVEAYCSPDQDVCIAKQAAGTECSSDAQCTGFCSETMFDTANYHKCQWPLNIDEPCERDAQCAHQCDDSVCTPLQEEETELAISSWFDFLKGERSAAPAQGTNAVAMLALAATTTFLLFH